MKDRGLRSPIAAFCSLALVAGLGAQEVPIFRTDVEAVHLACTVLDRQGRYVQGLGVEDFEVYENGRRQDVEFFYSVSGGEAPPAFLALVMDTSDSVTDDISKQQQVALEFLKSGLRPGEDQAAVVHFSTRVRLVTDFTPDPKRLERAILEVSTGGTTRLYDALWLVVTQLLRGQDGRRLIVLFTDGDDRDSRINRDEVVRALQTYAVTLLAIGVRSPDYTADFKLLEEICRLTGGFFVDSDAGIDRLRRAMARIHEQIDNQYILGYVSSVPKGDSPYREVRVEVKRRRGARVQHRQGYFVE